MSEQDVEQETNATPNEETRSGSVADDVRKQLLLVSAAQLRKAIPRRRLFGGYRRSDIDYLIERAATTIDDFGLKVETLQAKIVELRDTQTVLEDRIHNATPLTPQEVAGEMFVTAHRAIEQVKEDAQREADRLVGDARAAADQVLFDAELQREEFEKLRSEAQSTIEDARREALELRAAVQNERERLIAESMAEAERARAGLEVEKAKLEAAISELRGTWVSFIGDALTKLEAIEPGAVAAEENGSHASPPESPPAPVKADDVVTELHDRLPNSAGNSTPG